MIYKIIVKTVKQFLLNFLIKTVNNTIKGVGIRQSDKENVFQW